MFVQHVRYTLYAYSYVSTVSPADRHAASMCIHNIHSLYSQSTQCTQSGVDKIPANLTKRWEGRFTNTQFTTIYCGDFHSGLRPSDRR